MSVRPFDPVAVEIHRRALESITNEAAITLTLTSGSPVIYEVQDFATSLLDRDGDQLSLSLTCLLHVGSSLLGTRALIDEIGPDATVRPGDGWIISDPYSAGAMHQGDVAIIMPQFYGDEHVGWAFANVHVVDVGGSGISGFAPSARSVYEEGVRFPPTKIVTGGAIEPGWERYIEANVRMPQLVLNDIRSMLAANNVSQRKLNETIDRYGLERFQEYCEINKQLTEQAFRRRLADLPDGVYETTEWVEFDGHGEPLLLEIGCRMTIDGSDASFAFSGAPQIDAFINGTPGVIHGNVMTAIMTTLGYGDLPFNAGMWRPVRIDVGVPGTIVNAEPPSAVSNGHAMVGTRIVKATKDLLNQACALSENPTLRARVAGQAWDSAGLIPLAGPGHAGAPTVVFFMDQVTGVGGGAESAFDGQDGFGMTVTPGIGLPSVETNEGQQPALYLWRALQQNSGGPGTHRGGHALESAYAIYDSDGLSGAVTIGCTEVPPHGVGGGMPASAGDWSAVHATNVGELLDQGRGIRPSTLTGDSPRQPSNTGRLAVARGDVIRMHGGGGGGLGDPLLRDPQMVEADVRDGYITDDHARAAYGVELDAGGAVDGVATDARRRQMRRERIGSDPARDAHAPESAGVAVRVAEGAGGRVWTCGYCGHEIAPTSENWRSAAVVDRQRISDRYGALGMQVRERVAGPDVVLVEHHCPECASLLAADVHPETFAGFVAPRLAER